MSLPPPSPGEMARANRRSRRRRVDDPVEAQRRRAARQMVMGPDFNLNNATAEQLLKLEQLNTGPGSSGVLPDQDERRRTSLARYAIRTGAKPTGERPLPPGAREGRAGHPAPGVRYAPRDLIDGRTGKPRPGVDAETLARVLDRRKKKPFKNPGRPVY